MKVSSTRVQVLLPILPSKLLSTFQSVHAYNECSLPQRSRLVDDINVFRYPEINIYARRAWTTTRCFVNIEASELSRSDNGGTKTIGICFHIHVEHKYKIWCRFDEWTLRYQPSKFWWWWVEETCTVTRDMFTNLFLNLHSCLSLLPQQAIFRLFWFVALTFVYLELESEL
jgi:hypothetical protein